MVFVVPSKKKKFCFNGPEREPNPMILMGGTNYISFETEHKI